MCTNCCSANSNKKEEFASKREREIKYSRDLQNYTNQLRASKEDFFFNKIECNPIIYNSVSTQFFILTKEETENNESNTKTNFSSCSEPNSEPLPVLWTKYELIQMELEEIFSKQ